MKSLVKHNMLKCAGLFYVREVWVGERDLVIMLVSTMSLLMYISIVMDMLQFMYCTYLNFILSSSGRDFHADFDLLSFFWFSRCVWAGGFMVRFGCSFYVKKKTTQDIGKVVSLTHRPLLPSGNAIGTHFC